MVFTSGCIFDLMNSTLEGGGMQSLKIKINESEDRNLLQKRTNIVDLIKRVKLEEKKEKRNTILIATTAAISVLAVSGLIISL